MANPSRCAGLCCLLVLFLVGASASRAFDLGDISPDFSSRLRSWTSARANAEGDFFLGEREEVIKGSGGSFSVWDKAHPVLQDTDVQAGVLRLESQGLLLPSYTDSHQVHYVVRGNARAGLVTPLGIPAGVRNLHCGDLLVHPRGWALWVWNNGQAPLEMISVSDTSRSTEQEGKRAPRAEQTRFWLIGGKEGEDGGIIHGFSEELLSQAWDVEVKDVQQLKEGQKESAIIKVSPKMAAAINTELDHADDSANAFFGDYVFDLEERERDYDDPKAGWISVVNGWKTRSLREVGFAAGRLHLEADAITAPRWVANTAALYYAIKGEAYVEAVYPNGQPAFRKSIKAGEAIVIPAGYARGSVAAKEGFEGVAFSLETSRPYAGFLAGGNSVFRAIPKNIKRAAFNVGDEVINQFAKARRDEYLLLRPRGQSPPPEKLGKADFLYPRDENEGMKQNGLAFF